MDNQNQQQKNEERYFSHTFSKPQNDIQIVHYIPSKGIRIHTYDL